MANAFDTTEYPTTEPATLVAGDRWLWKRDDLTDYPVASYALTYEAVLDGDGTDSFTITADESGTDYLVQVASATTVGYTAGTYRWRSFITRSSDSERIQIGSGTWEVKPDPATATDDPRSWIKVTLDALEATIQGKASLDQLSYSIAGRSLSRMSPEELMDWYDRLKTKYEAEQAAEAAANGRASGNLVRVYMP